MIKRIMLCCAFILILLFQSCDDPSSSDDKIDYENIQEISYLKHVQPILNEYSRILDHNGIFPQGLNMDSWNTLIEGWENGEIIIPFDSENSLLIELTTKLEKNTELDSVKLNFLKRWIDEGANNNNGTVPYEDSDELLYVCSQAEAIINVIDISSMIVIRNIKLTDFGLPSSAKPHHIAISPDGDYLYISCIDNKVNKVLQIDRNNYWLSGEVITKIPALMDHHPTESILYISRFMLNNSTTSIFVVNTQTMQPVSNGNNGEISLPPGITVPHAMQLSKDGAFVYTASFAEDQFVVVNHDSKEFEEALFLGGDKTPLQCAVSPGNDRVYLSCIGTGEIMVINVEDPANRFIETTIDLGGQPWHGTFSRNGEIFYVSNFASNSLNIINTQDYSVQNIGSGDGRDGLSQPHGIALTADGTRVLVSCRNTTGAYQPKYNFMDNNKVGTVVAVNTSSGEIEKVLEIENFGSGMRLWDDPHEEF